MSTLALKGLGSAIGIALLTAAGLPTATVLATSTGPTVIAVHRNGGIDMSGNNSFGTIANLKVGAGNWSISATATIQAVASVSNVECQLVAGPDFYKSLTIPTAGGAGSSQPIVLLIAQHFASNGTVTLKCKSDGWLGDVIVRDVHLTAVKVAQLSAGDAVYGSGSPVAAYGQNVGARGYTNSGYQDLQDLALPAGTWLVHAVAWGGSATNGDRIDCDLSTASPTPDQFVTDFEMVQRGIAFVDVFTLASPGQVHMYCKDTAGLWYVYGSAISALGVGTLKYGALGGSMTTTGSGSPTVVGGYNDSAGGVPASMTLSSIASESLGGSWVVDAKSSFFAAATANTTCQLRLKGATDQGRVILDPSSNMINWMEMSLTKKLTATASASLACGQSSSTNNVVFLHIRLFALKAGSLTDTNLD